MVTVSSSSGPEYGLQQGLNEGTLEDKRVERGGGKEEGGACHMLKVHRPHGDSDGEDIALASFFSFFFSHRH